MTLATDMSVFPEELTALEGWEEYITDFDESEYEPLWGYIEETVGAYNLSIDDLPDADTFRDAYCGEWSSFVECATEYIDECDFFSDYSYFVSRYFDYEKFADDLIGGYYTHDEPNWEVYAYQA